MKALRNGWKLEIQECLDPKCCFLWVSQRMLVLLHGVFRLRGKILMPYWMRNKINFCLVPRVFSSIWYLKFYFDSRSHLIAISFFVFIFLKLCLFSYRLFSIIQTLKCLIQFHKQKQVFENLAEIFKTKHL